MIIYRDTNSDFVFQHPHPGPLSVSIQRDGKELRKVQNVTPVAGRYSVKLNYNETKYDGKVFFVWTGPGGFTTKNSVDVFTPLVPLSVIKTYFTEIKSDNELQMIENQVRLVIESYTGQKFGLFKEVREGKAVNGSRMSFNGPLISIDAETPGMWVSDAMITVGGTAIQLPTVSYMTLKQAPPEEYLNQMVVGGVIRTPNYRYSFQPDSYYRVYGEWGYTHIPADVQEAARLLINDYSCNDSVYRERYFDNVSYDRTNLGLNAMAFQGTGNVVVDQLLDKYRKIGAGVV